MLNWQGAGRHERRMAECLNLIFQNHPQLLDFLFEKGRARLRREPERLLDGAREFSGGEQVLIRVALDLWNGTGKVRMWEILESLDEENYQHVLAGLRHLRPIEEDGAPMVWRQPKMARL